MASNDDRFRAQLLWLIQHFMSEDVRNFSEGVLTSDSEGNLSWQSISASLNDVPNSGGIGLFDYGLITDATSFSQDYDLVSRVDITLRDWGGLASG